MRYIAIALLLFALPVSADHHRGHALGFLEKVQPRIDAIREHAVNIASMTTPNTHLRQMILTPMGDLVGVFPGNIDGIEQRTLQAQNALRGNFDPMCYQLGFNPGEDLQCARRLINQPREAIGVRSSLQFTTGAMYGMTIFVLWEDGTVNGFDSDGDISIVLGNLNRIWADTQQAAWHIDDAIREEVYLDNNFAE